MGEDPAKVANSNTFTDEIVNGTMYRVNDL